MTEELWKLRKENVALKKALIEAQFSILQTQHKTVTAEDMALGEAWSDKIGLAEQKVKSVK